MASTTLPPFTAPPSLTTPELPASTNDTTPFATLVEPTAHLDPRCSSKLHPAFADVLVCDHELRETKRLEDARRRESERRAKQMVKVFAWTVNGREPVVSSFQGGFIWPFFNLSYEVLAMVGLLDAGEDHSLELYDDAGFQYWMKVEIGHIVEVREGHSIFLRSTDVEICPGFRDHLATFRKSTPIIYGQFVRERQYVRDYVHTWETDWDIVSTPRKRKASISPSGSSAESAPLSPASLPSLPDIIEKKLVSRPPSAATSSCNQPPTPSSAQPESDTTPAICNLKEWPRDFYVCDIVNCFLDCKTSVKRGGKSTRTLKTVFKEHFPGIQFKPSTYHDQRNMWRDAPEHLKKRFNEAGRTKVGRWVLFANAVRQAAQPAKDVIELSD